MPEEKEPLLSIPPIAEDMRLGLNEDGEYQFTSNEDPPDAPDETLEPEIEAPQADVAAAQYQAELELARRQTAEAQRTVREWQQYYASQQQQQAYAPQPPDPQMQDFFTAAGGQDKLAAWVHQEAIRVADHRYGQVLQQQQQAIAAQNQKLMKMELDAAMGKYPDIAAVFTAKLPQVQALIATGNSIEDIYRTLNPTAVRTQKKQRTVNPAQQADMIAKQKRLQTERGTATPEDGPPKIRTIDDAFNLALRQLQSKKRAG